MQLIQKAPGEGWILDTFPFSKLTLRLFFTRKISEIT